MTRPQTRGAVRPQGEGGSTVPRLIRTEHTANLTRHCSNENCLSTILPGERYTRTTEIRPHRPVVKRVWCHKCAKTEATR